MRMSKARVVDLIEPGVPCKLEYVDDSGEVIIRAVWGEIAVHYGWCLFGPFGEEILEAAETVLLDSNWRKVTEWTTPRKYPKP